MIESRMNGKDVNKNFIILSHASPIPNAYCHLNLSEVAFILIANGILLLLYDTRDVKSLKRKI